MAISAKDVNRLRQATGAGMMDCKKALTEAEGDFDKAVDILRKKGQKVSSKRADRDAKEGAIFIKANADASEAVMIELNCETDFVARNEEFIQLGESISGLALDANPADVNALKAMEIDGRAISSYLEDMMGKIGEKIDVRKYERISGEKVVTYLHPGSRIGVAVAFASAGGDNVDSVGRDVAMQIAAMSPAGIDKDDVPQEIVQKEIEFGMTKAKEEGKPEKIWEKIAQGMLNKYFKENTLLNQEFVKDTSKTVGKHIQESLGKEAKITKFKRFQLGAN